MAVKPEGRFANTLRSNCNKIHFLKIDSWSTPGMPDLYGLFEHEETKLPGTFWAELKCTKINKLGLSPQQIAINLKLSEYNIPNYILAKSLSQRALKIFPGYLVQDAATDGFKSKSHVACFTEPFPWTEIQKSLMHDPTNIYAGYGKLAAGPRS
jgi:hypothetical protein